MRDIPPIWDPRRTGHCRSVLILPASFSLRPIASSFSLRCPKFHSRRRAAHCVDHAVLRLGGRTSAGRGLSSKAVNDQRYPRGRVGVGLPHSWPCQEEGDFRPCFCDVLFVCSWRQNLLDGNIRDVIMECDRHGMTDVLFGLGFIWQASSRRILTSVTAGCRSYTCHEPDRVKRDDRRMQGDTLSDISVLLCRSIMTFPFSSTHWSGLRHTQPGPAGAERE